MLNKNQIKEKSEELKIPFANLLSAVLCEEIIMAIARGTYSEELFLCNFEDFSTDYYKIKNINEIYYDYNKDIDIKMELLYLRDILKEIIATLEKKAEIKGKAEANTISLEIITDGMYVPIKLKFSRIENVNVIGEESVFENIDGEKINLLTSSKENIVINDLYEIIEKLELINNMDCYYDVYRILVQYPVNGRKIKDGLEKKLVENEIEISELRIKQIEEYEKYSYMKKKWKVELRQKKKSEPEWTDLINCLIKFLRPIWNAMESKQVFLGDWMPQLKRYLD